MIFFNSRGNLPSFGLTSALGINNYARIKLSFLRSFLFFFQRDERMVGHGRSGVDTCDEVERSFQQDGGF